jgi:hypothetical protein
VLASGTHRPRHRLKLRIRQGIHKGDALRCRTRIKAHDSVELHGGMDALLIEVRKRFDCSDAISRTRKRIDDQFKQFSGNGLIRLGGYIPALVDGSLDDAQVLPLFPSLGALCRGSPNPSWRASGLTRYPVFVRRGVFVPVQVEDLLQFQRSLRRGHGYNVAMDRGATATKRSSTAMHISYLGELRIFQIRRARWLCASNSIRANAPIREYLSQVSSVDHAIVVEINARLSSRAPCCEQDAEVSAIGRAALVEIGRAFEQQTLAGVDDAVLI